MTGQTQGDNSPESETIVFKEEAATGASLTGRRESQASRIARLLIERIRNGEYPVGTRIPSERVLANEFEVSRPVVREALSTVTAMEILDVQMGRGAFVTALPADRSTIVGSNLQDVVNVREILEVGALELCRRRTSQAGRGPVQQALDRLSDAVAQRTDTAVLDRALHSAIIQSSGSKLLADLWQGLEQQIEETIRISPHGQSMSAPIIDLHRTLANGVILGAIPEAVAASRQLHEQNRAFLRNLLG